MNRSRALAAFAVALSLSAAARGDEPAKQAPPEKAAPLGERPTHRIPRIDERPKIDGAVGETVWQRALRFDLPYEIEPDENVPAPVATECFVYHDAENLYVAFRAADPNPAEIRAHLSDRDLAFRDDFVGFMVDTFDDTRRGFEFFVNPIGVQMDLSRNETGGGSNEDSSWDAIWDAAARITAAGYEAEMAIPFEALRFARTDGEKTWGFMPFRAYPRSVRHQIAPVPFDRNVNCFFCQTPRIVGFSGIVPGRAIELDPTLTGQRHDERRDFPDGSLEKEDSSLDAGLSARWGITPNLSLNAAVNPDFSQVEADVAQLDLNQKFTLFYPEKRPFFLEGADFFRMPMSMVHTRTISDPAWGLKLTGKEGGAAIGAIVARDDVTTILVPGNQGAAGDFLVDSRGHDLKTTDAVLRWRQDVGATSTLGVVGTFRDGGSGYRNGVGGVDANVKLGSWTLRAQALRSETRYPADFAAAYAQPAGTFTDSVLLVTGSWDTRDWNAWAGWQQVGPGFRADTGFLSRVDYKDWNGGFQRSFYGDPGDFLNRVQVWVDGGQTHTFDGLLTDQVYALNVFLAGPRQMTLDARVAKRKEYWSSDPANWDPDDDEANGWPGVTYDLDRQNWFFNIRPTGDFTCSLGGNLGDYVDYSNARKGKLTRLFPGITWNIGLHFYLQLDHTFERFDVDPGRLYTANLTQARLVWQFDTRMFVRAIFQYVDVDANAAVWDSDLREPGIQPYDDFTSRSRNLFTQLLFSYKVNPQTLLFVGYSDNRDGWKAVGADGSEVDSVGLTQRNRTVFLKLGYAWLL